MRWSCAVSGLLLLFTLGAAEAAIHVQVDGDRLTLRAENAPLQDILRTVATAGQFSLRLDAPLTNPITVQFVREPLLDALEALLRDQNMVIRYAREGGMRRVEDVQVLAPSLQSGGTQGAARNQPANPRMHGAPGGGTPISEPAPQEQGTPAADRIAEALAQVEGGQPEAARQVLIDLARTHEEPEVRQEALAVLTGLESAPLEPFASAAVGDKDESVRLMALALVGERAQTEQAAREVLRGIAEGGSVPPIHEDGVDLRLIAGAVLEDLRRGTP